MYWLSRPDFFIHSWDLKFYSTYGYQAALQAIRSKQCLECNLIFVMGMVFTGDRMLKEILEEHERLSAILIWENTDVFHCLKDK